MTAENVSAKICSDNYSSSWPASPYVTSLKRTVLFLLHNSACWDVTLEQSSSVSSAASPPRPIGCSSQLFSVEVTESLQLTSGEFVRQQTLDWIQNSLKYSHKSDVWLHNKSPYNDAKSQHNISIMWIWIKHTLAHPQKPTHGVKE